MGNEIIQADYEELDRIANIFSQHASNTAELHQKVLRSVDELKGGGWIGLGATAFYDEMEGQIFPAIFRLSDAFVESEKITRKTAEILQAAEEEASHPFDGYFSWSDFQNAVIPHGAEKLLGLIAKKFTFGDYRSVGRFINLALGNERAGWVGRMDRLGHIFEGKWIQDGVPLGLGVIFDEDFKGDKARAVGGELISFGIGKVATRFIPGAGWALAGSDGLQLAGNLVAGGLEKLGYSGQAQWLQNSLERIDLGEYVENFAEEQIYDRAVNWYKNPEQITKDLDSAKKWIDKYDGGLLDTGKDLVGNASKEITDWFAN